MVIKSETISSMLQMNGKENIKPDNSENYLITFFQCFGQIW